MLNEKQKSWLCDKCDSLLIAADDYQIADDKWDELISKANDISILAKGNPDVKAAVVATITYIETMYKIMEGKNNG